MGFIFIKWDENKYFTSGDSHEWNMIIFMPRDENNSYIYRKKLEFSVYYVLSIILMLQFDTHPFKLCILTESSLAGEQWKYGKYEK